MIALITGAAGGLGRAMAAACAERGYDLFLTDLPASPLPELATGLRRQYDVGVTTCACDLTDINQVDALFSALDAHSIKPNMLLNVAGIDHEGGFLLRDSKAIRAIVRLNIEATLEVTHAALQRRADGPFHIVMVSSLASLYPIPLKATYAASKRFLLNFSLALQQELRGEGVHILALCPGGLPTTQEARNGIAAQGFWGNATASQVNDLARRTINRALAGRRIYIPGIMNGVLAAAGKMAPPSLIAKLLYGRWKNAQKKWLTS